MVGGGAFGLFIVFGVPALEHRRSRKTLRRLRQFHRAISRWQFLERPKEHGGLFSLRADWHAVFPTARDGRQQSWKDRRRAESALLPACRHSRSRHDDRVEVDLQSGLRNTQLYPRMVRHRKDRLDRFAAIRVVVHNDHQHLASDREPAFNLFGRFAGDSYRLLRRGQSRWRREIQGLPAHHLAPA